MKLFLIKYRVELGQGKDLMTFEDQMAIPGMSEARAKSMFLEIISGAGNIIMSPGSTKILAPIRAFAGKVSVLSCTVVKTK